jgi:hypothetical protein
MPPQITREVSRYFRELLDVDLVTVEPQDGDTIIYDLDEDKWKPAPSTVPPYSDATAIIKGSADPTKQLRFEIDGFATEQTRVATPPDEDFQIGFRNIPQVSKGEDYVAVLSDSGKHLFHPASDDNPRTFTIPANDSVALPIGSAITFVNKANVLTIAINTDTLTWAEDGTTGSRTLAANGIATALKITATEWIISGTGLL